MKNVHFRLILDKCQSATNIFENREFPHIFKHKTRDWLNETGLFVLFFHVRAASVMILLLALRRLEADTDSRLLMIGQATSGDFGRALR